MQRNRVSAGLGAQNSTRSAAGRAPDARRRLGGTGRPQPLRLSAKSSAPDSGAQLRARGEAGSAAQSALRRESSRNVARCGASRNDNSPRCAAARCAGARGARLEGGGGGGGGCGTTRDSGAAASSASLEPLPAASLSPGDASAASPPDDTARAGRGAARGRLSRSNVASVAAKRERHASCNDTSSEKTTKRRCACLRSAPAAPPTRLTGVIGRTKLQRTSGTARAARACMRRGAHAASVTSGTASGKAAMVLLCATCCTPQRSAVDRWRPAAHSRVRSPTQHV